MQQLTADQLAHVEAFVQRHDIPDHLHNQLLRLADSEKEFCDNLMALFQLRTKSQIKQLEASTARFSAVSNDLAVNSEHIRWACLASNSDINLLRESLQAISSKLEHRKELSETVRNHFGLGERGPYRDFFVDWTIVALAYIWVASGKSRPTAWYSSLADGGEIDTELPVEEFDAQAGTRSTPFTRFVSEYFDAIDYPWSGCVRGSNLDRKVHAILVETKSAFLKPFRSFLQAS